MINPEELEKNISIVRDEIEAISKSLYNTDLSRLNSLHEYLQSSDSKKLEEFRLNTGKSVLDLEKFEKLFLNLMSYVMLVKEKGHKDNYFQELLMRYTILEKQIKKLKNYRESEILFAANILLKQSRRYSQWRLRSKIHKEKNMLQLMIAVYNKNKEKLILIKNPNRSRAAGYSISWDFLILTGKIIIIVAEQRGMYPVKKSI
mgnify:CR=1 FL=1